MKRSAEEDIEINDTKQQKYTTDTSTHASTVSNVHLHKTEDTDTNTTFDCPSPTLLQQERDFDTMDDKALIDWLDDFDKLLLHNADGTDAVYGSRFETLMTDGWLEMFRGTKLSNTYYKRNPEKLESDGALCQDICSLPILHGIITFLQTRPQVCHGSYQIQVVCHVIKEKLVRNNRDIPAFLKRLIQLYHEYEYPDRLTKDYPWKDYHLKNTEKHLKLMIIIFLTDNLSFLLFGPRTLFGITYSDRYQLCVEDIKNEIYLPEVILHTMSPADTYGSFDAGLLDYVTHSYMEQRLTEWRKYMYSSAEKPYFKVKSLRMEIKTKKVMKILPSY